MPKLKEPCVGVPHVHAMHVCEESFYTPLCVCVFFPCRLLHFVRMSQLAVRNRAWAWTSATYRALLSRALCIWQLHTQLQQQQQQQRQRQQQQSQPTRPQGRKAKILKIIMLKFALLSATAEPRIFRVSNVYFFVSFFVFRILFCFSLTGFSFAEFSYSALFFIAPGFVFPRIWPLKCDFHGISVDVHIFKRYGLNTMPYTLDVRSVGIIKINIWHWQRATCSRSRSRSRSKGSGTLPVSCHVCPLSCSILQVINAKRQRRLRQ